MADSLSKAQGDLMRLINDQGIAQMVGSTLAEIAVELMDAKQEAAHWKKSFETVRDEIKVLASVALLRLGEDRLVITQAHLSRFNETNTTLYVDTPEPGVRIYELREASVSQAVSAIMRPN